MPKRRSESTRRRPRAPQPTLLAGRYEIVGELGKGGMGVVHEAIDRTTGQRVAVKTLSSKVRGDLVALLRFKREARTASSLSHPNICRMLDIAETDESPVIVMERLEGSTLKEVFARGSLTSQRALDIAVQTARGLQAAHNRHIVHRDVKPANVFATDDGHIKLLDFGLAKHFVRLDATMSSITVTEADHTPGTVDYMSPEQLLGRRLDARTDLFSLGVVLYEMLAGRHPFHAPSRMETMAAILHRHPPALPAIACVGAWSRVLMQLLAKDPEHRYPDAAALLQDLERLARELKGDRVRWPTAPSSETRAAVPSVVVMPLEVRGEPRAEDPGRHEATYFAHGLIDEVQGALEHHGGIRVVPRTLVSRLTARHRSAGAAGRRFHADWVLAGTVVDAGDAFAIDLTLHCLRSRTRSVTSHHRAHANELFRVRDAVVREVLTALGMDDTTSPPPGPVAVDRRAFHLCLKGRFFWNKRYEGGLLTARQCFEDAIRLDPGLAPAHAGLADTYSFLGFYCLIRPRDAFGVARSSVQAALKLDDRSAEAYTSRGLIELGGNWDWGAAERSFSRAIELNAAAGTARIYRSWVLTLLGRVSDAHAEAERAQDIDPLSPALNAGAAYTLFLSRDYERSIRECEKALEVTPDFLVALYVMGLCKAQLGLRHEAAEHLDRAVTLSGGMPFYLGLLGKILADMGETARAQEILDRLNQMAGRVFVPAHCYVYIYAGLGDFDRAFAWQDKAFEEGASPFNYLAPIVECLHGDPRFTDDLRAWGLDI